MSPVPVWSPLPNELLIMIYKESDYTSRIQLNKLFNWTYYDMNPYTDYNMKKRNDLNIYISSKWIECGFFKYPKISKN